MPLSKAQVEHIARLARLNLTPEEIDRFTTELTVILDYIDQLESVDTTGVKLQNQFAKAENVLRNDVVEPSLSQNSALGNAPQHDDQYFLVPKVLGS